ncbi:hypothetical protein CYMTET_34792, partial [Cymbomonas tetramitiformis]
LRPERLQLPLLRSAASSALRPYGWERFYERQSTFHRSQQKVGELSVALRDAQEELSHWVLVVQTISSTMPQRHEFRWAMDLIDTESSEMVPMRASSQLVPDDFDDMDYDFDDINGLASLRRQLKRSTTVFLRTKRQYITAVQEAFTYEDIVENKRKAKQGSPWRFRSVGQSPGGGFMTVATERVMYINKCFLRALVRRLAACTLPSLASIAL